MPATIDTLRLPIDSRAAFTAAIATYAFASLIITLPLMAIDIADISFIFHSATLAIAAAEGRQLSHAVSLSPALPLDVIYAAFAHIRRHYFHTIDITLRHYAIDADYYASCMLPLKIE